MKVALGWTPIRRIAVLAHLHGGALILIRHDRRMPATPAAERIILAEAIADADGKHHIAITETADDGPISHYVHPSGIANAPVREFTES
ncbi:hypothetical protein ACIA59_10555 [Micromonospora haikouensis]|uniref:hypothetical protein n=1 Tax=Micromonospora haikouensis TaxID=686309 RepID=UPI0037A7E493